MSDTKTTLYEWMAGKDDPEWRALKDAPPDKWGRTFIQWKGTDVCVDISLPCGCAPHIDGDFAYFIKCGCGRTWQMGTSVMVREVPTHIAHLVRALTETESMDDE